MMSIEKGNVYEKLSAINDHWNPRIVGELNSQHVKLVKIKGEFTWHKHDEEDEMFFVLKGSFVMEMRDKSIEINEGDFIIIPKGTEHRPVAEDEAAIMLFEPAATLNTGDKQNEFTRAKLKRL